MRAPLYLFLAALPLAVPLFGCGDDPTLVGRPNATPIANGVVFDADYYAGGSVSSLPGPLGFRTIGTDVAVDGTPSLDAETVGRELTFLWSFVDAPNAVPEGSTVTNDDLVFGAEDDPETGWLENSLAWFVPDVEGTYRLQLIVVDAGDKESEPALVYVHAQPPANLEVRLDWADTRADLDLHLVTEGGSYWDADTDCFSWYPRPSWGDPVLGTDDPTLIDDMDGEGAGPYNERIRLPAPGAERYEIYVHYFADHAAALNSGNPRSADPSVTIRVAGEQRDEIEAPQLLQAGQVWHVGTLEWPTGNVVPNTDSTAIRSHSELGGPPYNIGN